MPAVVPPVERPAARRRRPRRRTRVGSASSLPLLCCLALRSTTAAEARTEAAGGAVPRHAFRPRSDARHAKEKEERIIGGATAEADRYPYAVSMFLNGKFGCAGTLIGKDTVLTAAHCISKGREVEVRVGSDRKEDGRTMAARRYVVHPDYDDVTDEYDVGLIFLEESVAAPSSSDVVVAFPGLNDDASLPYPGTVARVMGWGDTDEEDERKVVSEDLVVADLEVLSNDACAKAEGGGTTYEDWIYDDMVCTYTEGRDACQGDSGGPLVVTGDGPADDLIVGIVSWGVGCSFLPGVFSRVSASHGWIRETVCDRRGSGDPPAGLCDTPIPTPYPTTVWPTESPSDAPTTYSPTDAPTDAPTGSPTSTPSVSIRPSGRPSARPTSSARPSGSPSTVPSTSRRPTARPSAASSAVPSVPPAGTSSPRGKEDRAVNLNFQTAPEDAVETTNGANHNDAGRIGLSLAVAVVFGIIATLI